MTFDQLYRKVFPRYEIKNPTDESSSAKELAADRPIKFVTVSGLELTIKVYPNVLEGRLLLDTGEEVTI